MVKNAVVFCLFFFSYQRLASTSGSDQKKNRSQKSKTGRYWPVEVFTPVHGSSLQKQTEILAVLTTIHITVQRNVFGQLPLLSPEDVIGRDGPSVLWAVCCCRRWPYSKDRERQVHKCAENRRQPWKTKPFSFWFTATITFVWLFS